MDNSANVGAYLLEKVRALAPKHACLGNIRGAGLFVAADIVSP
jgi:4-aminobutyrate aminotransferase-like enzyme